MALNAAQQWWVRAGGSETNGGGYDATISGAGVNYSDQDAAQLTLTDVVTTGTTSVTSVTGGFTSNMIGNIIRIVGDGYYAITARTNTNTITVDRATGTNVAQTASIGGAHPSFINYAAGGTATAPALTTPLASGHTINIRGGGTDDPGSADYSQSGFYTMPHADPAVGQIHVIGYNGRPRFDADTILLNEPFYWMFENMVFYPSAAPAPTFGLLYSGPISCRNCLFDQNAFDQILINGAGQLVNCEFRSTGAAGTNSNPAIRMGNYAGQVLGCYIHDINGIGISAESATGVNLMHSIIANCATHGVVLGGILQPRASIINTTIYGCVLGDAISITDSESLAFTLIMNNILSNNGGYGINVQTGTAASNDLFLGVKPDYNDFYSNTGGARQNLNAGPHDLALDPQFTNAAGGDFSIGTNLAAQAFPGTFP